MGGACLLVNRADQGIELGGANRHKHSAAGSGAGAARAALRRHRARWLSSKGTGTLQRLLGCLLVLLLLLLADSTCYCCCLLLLAGAGAAGYCSSLATLRFSTALVWGHCISCQLMGTMGTPARGGGGPGGCREGAGRGLQR